MYEIRERTPEEIANFKARHEGKTPDPFILQERRGNEDQKPMILSGHQTREDAEKELECWKVRDEIEVKVEDLRCEVLEIAKKHGLDEVEALKIAEEHFR